MCLIIYKPSTEVTFNPEYMRTSVTRNDDGAGCMYVKDGRVIVEKTEGVFAKDITVDTITEWCLARLNSTDSIAIHHRMTTDGCNHLDNIHPYKVLSIDDGDPIDLYMMHNGIISKCRPNKHTTTSKYVYSMHDDGDDDYYPYPYHTNYRNLQQVQEVVPSDTQLFITNILQPILKHDHTILQLPQFHALIQEYIGNGSKLIFLDNENNWTIINEDAGTWLDKEGGCWLSNTYSHRPTVVHNYQNTRTWEKVPTSREVQVPITIPANNKGTKMNSTKTSTTSISRKPITFWEGKSVTEIIEYLCLSTNPNDLGTLIEDEPLVAEEVLEELLNHYWNSSLNIDYTSTDKEAS